MSKNKIYLAHPISNDYEARASIEMAEALRGLAFEVYAAAENKSITDKTNDPTPTDIYNADVEAILESDIFVVNLTGGYQDGTISEIGLVAGYNEKIGLFGAGAIPIFAYTSNSRLHNPQFSDGIPSAGANHLVKGMIDRWGEFYRTKEDMLEALREWFGE